MDKVSLNKLRGVVKACVNNSDCREFYLRCCEKIDQPNEERCDFHGIIETIDTKLTIIVKSLIGKFYVRCDTNFLEIKRVVEDKEEACDIEQEPRMLPESWPVELE